jgi:membrane protein required for colicin V production
MSGIDITILIIVVFCGVMGLYWGIIRQVLSVVGFVAGIILAVTYERDVADLLSSWVTEETLARIIAFILIMVAVSGTTSLIASLVHKLAGLLFLGWADHLAGGVLGLAQGILICATALIVGATIPNQLWLPVIRNSEFAQPIVNAGSVVLFGLRLLPESFQMASKVMFGVP